MPSTRTPPASVSERGSFDILMRAFHWTTVVLVAFLGASGYASTVLPFAASTVLLWHRSAGAGLWGVTVLRILWRRSYGRMPSFPHGMWRLHQWAVTASEYAMYGLLLVQPLTGLAASIAAGAPFRLFGTTIPALVPTDVVLLDALRLVHRDGALALAGVVGVHATAALFHHYVLHDDTLVAMLPSAGGIPAARPVACSRARAIASRP